MKQATFIQVPARCAAEYQDSKVQAYSHTRIRVPRGFGQAYLRVLREQGTPTAGAVVDALGLIGYRVLRCVVLNEWSAFQRLEAFVWAMSEHLRASDNPLPRHPLPAWARSLKEYRAAVANGGEIFDPSSTYVPGKFTPREGQILCDFCRGVHC